MEPSFTGDRIFTRDGTYFQIIKQYFSRYKKFVSNMPSCHESSPTDIRMWYHYVTIKYVTHGIYINPYYCFIYEANYSKVFSAGSDTNTTKHYLPEKIITMLPEWGGWGYTAIGNDKIPPKDCDNHKFIIRNHYPSGYEALYYLISSNHTNNLTHTIYLISAPPTQLKAGDPLSNNFHRCKYYL